jgi:hypothetical protein
MPEGVCVLMELLLPQNERLDAGARRHRDEEAS